MKKINKISIVFLLSLMLITALASCGKKEEAETGGEQTEPVTATADPELEKARKFAGEWTDEASGAVLDIWVGNDAVCHGEIFITHSENELSFWTFSGSLIGDEIVYLDGERVDAHYDDASDLDEESIYTRGRGYIGFSGETLYWDDSKENAGEGMVFKYYGEY